MPKFSELETFERAYQQCRRYIDERLEHVYGWHIGTWIDGDHRPLESPIEANFYLWWLACEMSTDAPTKLRLVQQKDVEVFVGGALKRYRLDFAIEPADELFHYLADPFGIKLKCAIELDGHEFHERTPQQVAARNQRDRDLQIDGWTVFHVSGSELFRDGAGAVYPVWNATLRQLCALKCRLVKELTGRVVEIGA